MSDEESFLARWSRRKAGETAEQPPATTAGDLAEEKDAEPTGGKPAEKTDEPFDLSKLPSIDSLGKDSDYSVFMQKGVPEDLRLKALRRMWATDPAIAGPDLLDMHAWDYTGTDGLKPLVAPAIEAVVAVAKEVLERAKDAPPAGAAPAADSPGDEARAGEPPDRPDGEGRG